MCETGQELSSRMLTCMLFSPRPICLLVTLVFITPLPSRAEDDRFAGLLAKSPFGHEEALPASDPALEFRGYVYTDSILLFNIAHTDTAGRIRSDWVALGEPQATDYVVRSFDQASDTVDVLYQGKRLSIKLKLSHVKGLATSELLPPATTINPDRTPDEQTQVEYIVTAIARRRALRLGNAQSTAQPGD